MSFLFLSLLFLSNSLNKEFNSSFNKKFGCNLVNILFFAKKLKFLSPMLATSQKNYNDNKTSRSVFS